MRPVVSPARAGTCALLWMLVSGAGVAGQEQRVEELQLHRSVADEVVEFFNEPTTIRFNGRAAVPEGGVIVGDVGVLGGPFTVAGEIRGDLVVVNGDLELAPGGEVDGDVTVIGGRLLSGSAANIRGTLTVYDQVVRVVEREGRLTISRRRRPRQLEGLGRSTFTVRAGTNYNRVEGLPVMFGPIFETRDPNSLKIEALGIWRTESGLTLHDEDLGYQLTVEQRFGSDRAFSVGGTVHSAFEPIADWGLTDLESSLATFFLHKDYRDYHERSGWSAFATASLPETPLSFRAEFRNERHRFAPVRSPWTLRRNDDPWRPQPLVAQGDLHSVVGEITWDDRNDPREPTDGWWVRATAIKGVGGDLVIPTHETADPFPAQESIEERIVPTDFAAGLLDLRRYARLGPDSDLGLRLFLSGSLDGEPMPPQFQQALGGEGSLPGYALFSLDCGARSRLFNIELGEEVRDERVYGYYGCDGAALVQLEYRGNLTFDLSFGPDDEEVEEEDEWDDWAWYPSIDLSPSWAAFFDIGKGWSRSDDTLDTDWVADVGLGFFLGDLGLYVALPLHGEEKDLNFFVRLHRRF